MQLFVLLYIAQEPELDQAPERKQGRQVKKQKKHTASISCLMRLVSGTIPDVDCVQACVFSPAPISSDVFRAMWVLRFTVVTQRLRGEKKAERSSDAFFWSSSLRDRASSLGLYARWHHSVLRSPAGLSAGERTTYTYVEYLRVNEAPTSRGQRFVEALRFCVGVQGLPLKSDAFSVRVSGNAERKLETKRITVKAPPLPVLLVLSLEKYTHLVFAVSGLKPTLSPHWSVEHKQVSLQGGG